MSRCKELLERFNKLNENFDVYGKRDGKKVKWNDKPFKRIEDARELIKDIKKSGIKASELEIVDSKGGTVESLEEELSDNVEKAINSLSKDQVKRILSFQDTMKQSLELGVALKKNLNLDKYLSFDEVKTVLSALKKGIAKI